MPNTNRFPGLASGPMDHKSSSIVNMISEEALDMGSAIQTILFIPSLPLEILHRVEEISGGQGSSRIYGIVVAGVIDGIYGNGSVSVDDSTRATNAAGQGVVILTQGRCLARVFGGTGGISVGNKLTQSAVKGVLELGISPHTVNAMALQDVLANDTDMIAVDVQREGDIP